MKAIKIISVSLIVYMTFGMVMHPLKMSTTEMSYRKKQLFIKTKVFTDDLEMTLREYCNEPNIDLINIGFDQKATACVKKHFAEHFKVFTNGKEVNLVVKKIYLKPNQNEVTMIEVVSENVTLDKSSKIKMRNTLLFKNIPEQKNLVNMDFSNTGHFDKTIMIEHEKGQTEAEIGLQ